MSLYRNSILQHPPVTFSEAGHIRRSSVHSIGRTSVFSGADEEQPQSPPHDFESDLDRGRQQKILEDKTFKVIKLGGGEEPPAEPYNCTTNPAPWWHQITIRSLVAGGVIGALLSIIIHKLSLTTGIIPSFNIAAGLLGFIVLRSWTGLLKRFGLTPHPFTPQENTVVQTCVVACSSLAFAGGFGCYLLSMDSQSFRNAGTIPGNRPEDVYEPEMQRVVPYMFCIGLIGIFTLVLLRKRFIIDYRLQFPSGTATGVLISSFHTPKGETAAREQVKTLGYWGCTSFLFSFFKWFFAAESTTGLSCGFDAWPSLGIKALGYTWQFDFELTYIGVGMIVPYVVAYSLMFGSIISWGIMWPLITGKAGDWYPSGLQDGDFRGLFGYKNFIAISVFVADGLYNFLKIGILSLQVFLDTVKESKVEQQRSLGKAPAVSSACHLPGARPSQQNGTNGTAQHDLVAPGARPTAETFQRNSQGQPICSLADVCDMNREAERISCLRDAVFLKGCIPRWHAVAGYAAFGILAIIVIPFLYHPVKWYYVLVLVFITPVFAVANAYGAGLTDFDMSSIYGTVCIFAFAAWATTTGGGVIAGLAISGFVMASTSSAASLMQDFKTGHITMSSPRSMFMAQIAGAVMGCFIAPLTFQMYWRSFHIGDPGGPYKAPYANIYRGMAILGTQGFGALPQHCGQLMGGFFAIAILMSLIRDVLPEKWSRFVPIPMAMAIPFYIGANVAIDICIGALVKAYWHWSSPATAEGKVPAAASGLIAGDGIWSIPSAILAITKVAAPICMSFAAAGTV